MASTSQKVVVVIVGKDELSGVAKKVQDALNGIGDAAEGAGRKTEGLSTKSIALGSMLGGLAGGFIREAAKQFQQLADRAFEVASTYEQQNITLTRLLGSQELATAALEKWNDESVKTPFTPEKYRESAIALKAFHFELKDISGYMRTAGDAASAFGDKISLAQMVDTLGRLKAGQFGESFEQLRRIGISLQDLKGEGLVFDKGGSYLGSVDQALAAVQKIVEDRFGGMMAEQAKSAKGLVSTIQGNWEQLLKTFMDSGPYDYIKRRLSEINDLLDYYNQSKKRSKSDIETAQIDQLKNAMDYLNEVQRKFTASGGTTGGWAKLVSSEFKSLKEQIKSTYDEVYNEAKMFGQKTDEQAKELANKKVLEEYSWAITGIYRELNSAKGKSEEYDAAISAVAAEHRKGLTAAKAYRDEQDKLKKAGEKLPPVLSAISDETLKAKEKTDPYEQLLKSLADKTIPALEAKYEAIGKVLNDVSTGKFPLAQEEVAKLNRDFMTLGVTLGKFGGALNTLDMDGFIDSLEAYQDFSIEGFQESLGIAQDFAAAMTGNYAALLKYLEAAGTETKKTMSDIEEIAVGLQQWSDGMAEFLDMLGLVGGELSDASAGIAQIGQGIQQITEAGEDFSALMDGVNSIGQGIAGIFGGEESDMSQLISGASNVGTGVAKALSGDLSGIVQALAGIPDLLDGLFESTQEGYVKQLGKQGFDDTYSQELLDKMSAVSDAMGDKSFGMKAYIEDFFKETDISNKDEFTRMSDLLDESIGEYISQGYTTEEAYAKYGDELEQLTAAQEKYGFETTESLQAMLDLQRSGTTEGRVSGISDAIGGIDKMIEGMSKAGYSDASFTSVFGLLQSSFQKLQAEGLSMQEIFEKVSPVVDKAREAAEKAGVSTAPMDALIAYTEKMKNASPILDVISGLDAAIKGLGSTGTLTQKNLDDMALTAQETIKKLEAQGFSPTEIAAQMGPAISDMTSAAEKFGYDLPQDIVDLGKTIEKLGLEGEKSPAEEIANWGTAYLEQTKAWGDSMIKTLEGLGGYAEGGVVPGNGGAQLAWVHGGETVVPPGAAPSLPALPAMINYNQQQQPLELKITLEQKAGGQNYLENLIGVTVEAKTRNGEIKIASSSMEG